MGSESTDQHDPGDVKKRFHYSASPDRRQDALKRQSDFGRSGDRSRKSDSRSLGQERERATKSARLQEKDSSGDYTETRNMSSSPDNTRRRRHDRSPRSLRLDRDYKAHRDRSPTARHRERRRRSRSHSRSRSPRPRLTDLNLSPKRRLHRSSSHSRSPKRRRPSFSGSATSQKRPREPLPSQLESYRGETGVANVSDTPVVEKEKPNFKTTGLLAAETNKVSVGSGNNAQSIVLKYHEPPEARKPPPSEGWILYVFRGSSPNPLQTIPLSSRSCWLLGREAAVADIPVDHPSCSKQHAIFQFRYRTKPDEYGEKKSKVKLYVLDLESANGTKLNGETIAAARYVECRSRDVITLGHSEREYVLLLPPKAK